MIEWNKVSDGLPNPVVGGRIVIREYLVWLPEGHAVVADLVGSRDGKHAWMTGPHDQVFPTHWAKFDPPVSE